MRRSKGCMQAFSLGKLCIEVAECLFLVPQEMDTSFGSLQQVAGAARTQADNLDDILRRSEAQRLR